ncbi:MAG TPA: right-handed parallel beta-helix repeat-containing protein, partial [Thermodesulfobacteriota bacterium]|nr:right-handed parallel beta-helix repeat-containing protein [Thermodesulfobacteriota bacterium]
MNSKLKKTMSNNSDYRRVVVSSGFLLAFLVLSLAITYGPLASVAKGNPALHSSILITSDEDFTPANGVVSGTGTAENPYLINNLTINDLSPGYGIKVDNSQGTITKYFNIQRIHSNFSTLPTTGTGANLVWLVNIHTETTISNVSGNAKNAEGTVGVALENSSNITLENLSLNRIGGNGVEIASPYPEFDPSHDITIMHSKIKAELSGLLLSNSHDITVSSNELTYNCYNGLTILDSYNILVKYTKTNANDTGGILVSGSKSYNINLCDGVSSGNGPLCRTESGIKTTTGEEVDTVGGIAIVNGASDIKVE